MLFKRFTYHFTHAVKNRVYNLFADGIMTTGVVISSILFTSDKLLRVVKVSIVSITDLIYK